MDDIAVDMRIQTIKSEVYELKDAILTPEQLDSLADAALGLTLILADRVDHHHGQHHPAYDGADGRDAHAS